MQITKDNTKLVYRGTTNSGPGTIIHLYEVQGLVEQPPQEAKDALTRIEKIIDSIPEADLKLIKQWGANVAFYNWLRSREHELPADLAVQYRREATDDAMKRSPVGNLESSWFNNNGGSLGVGISVRFIL